MKSPPVIGLLGGIGSGKSAVADMFRSLGCMVSDADQLAHEALNDPEVVAELRDHWGGDVIDEAGRPDRAAIGSIVFLDESERAWLERLVHPLVNKAREDAFSAAPDDVRALIIDAPLILEAGLDARCDHLVFIEVSRSERLARVARTRGWNEAELARREAAQIDLDEKRLKADFILDNNGNLGGLPDEVRGLLHKILDGVSGSP
ncbi:MAG: dephospho-CoA kinase [Phycisphaerales bacterium]|jgi:dephospho-CoA kinase|nr:dephospho-CoA kinase [Phycisphaerales bacterium]